MNSNDTSLTAFFLLLPQIMLPKFTLGGQDGDKLRIGTTKFEVLSRRNGKHAEGMALAALMEKIQALQKGDEPPSQAQRVLIDQANELIRSSKLTSTQMVTQYARRIYLWDPSNARKERVAWAEEHIRPLVKGNKEDNAKLNELQNPKKNDTYSFMQLRSKNPFNSAAANEKWKEPENSYVYEWFPKIVVPRTKISQMRARKLEKQTARGRDPPKAARVDVDEVYNTVVPEVLDNVLQWMAQAKTTPDKVLNQRYYKAYLAVAACLGRRREEILNDEYRYTVVDREFLTWTLLSKQGGEVRDPLRTPVLAEADRVGHALEFVRMVTKGLNKSVATAAWLKNNYPTFRHHIMVRGIYSLMVWKRREEFGYNKGTTREQIRKEVLGHKDYEAGAHYPIDMEV
jgi:hypothetical protein